MIRIAFAQVRELLLELLHAFPQFHVLFFEIKVVLDNDALQVPVHLETILNGLLVLKHCPKRVREHCKRPGLANASTFARNQLHPRRFAPALGMQLLRDLLLTQPCSQSLLDSMQHKEIVKGEPAPRAILTCSFGGRKECGIVQSPTLQGVRSDAQLGRRFLECLESIVH